MLIPFSRLYLSDANVRKTRSEEDDIQLSADIEARGLLQNLLVTKSKKRGKFAVIAGGRRLRAIEMIVTRGAWAPDTEIECKLLEGSEEDAGEASLAENFQRVGMSPAEECRAFQHFIKEGSDVAAVAKRFGLTQRFVEGRLRLANLAEPIFEALAKGDVTLEIAKAYAATDQHEVQLRVFEQMRYAYNPSADAIRRMVASGSMRGNDPIALLIGEDAYVAAGGKIERDLFSEAADDRWIDIEIGHRLAAEKMEAEAQRITAETGLAWISPVASTNSWQARSEMGVNAVRLPPAPLSEEARARIDAIDARMEEISEIIDEGEEGGDTDFGQLEAEYEDLDAARMARMRPPAADTILWDSIVPGFGLRCFASGAKSWVIRFRDRRARRLKTIGHPPALDVHRARRTAQVLIAAAELAGLPLPEDTQAQEQDLFGTVAEELMGALARSWKPSTLKRNQDALRRELIPAFGEMPIATILKPDVVRWRDSMASRPHAFNRALPVLSMLMQEAQRFGYRKPSSNPCRLIPRYPTTKKERFLSHREYRSLAAVLKDAEGEMSQAVAIIRLLIYTGARSGEITGLRWEWIKPPRIFLPDSKTGAKVILLNAPARAVLERVGQGTHEREGLVFPNSAGTAPMNIQPHWIALRARAGLRHMRLHDLRHSFASVAIREGISLVQIGRLLSHALPETTERYAHLADDDVAQAAERVSSAIAAGLGLRP